MKSSKKGLVIFKSKKHIALSLVALLLILMMTVGVTYSWVDDIKLVEIKTETDGDNIPLKTGIDINSDVEIVNDSENTSIDLGNMYYGTNNESDLKYTDNNKKIYKYDHNVSNANDPNWNNIDKRKGYFYESGNMHFGGCYSDGETFYFPTSQSNTYRQGNKDDENVNYISFTARVSSPNANVSFWFSEVPTIKKHGTNTEIDSARYAINVDGKTNVYSASGSANTCNSSLNATTPVNGVRKTSKFTYGNNENNDSNNNNPNCNTLFSIKKGGSVNLNVKIWLEGNISDNISASDIQFKLVSSWAYSRTITIEDKTTAKAASSWIGNPTGHPAKLYLTLPAVLAEINSNVDSWKNLSGAPFYPLTRVGDQYTVQIPMIYNNEQMVLYRCTDDGWNSSQHAEGDNPKSRGPENYKVLCWNWWQSSLPDTFHDETYTLYGSSYDDTAYNRFGGTETNKGYGTWGDVVEIQFDGKSKSVDSNDNYGSGNNLADSAGTMFIRDYSDYSSSNEIYTYIMVQPSSGSTVWKTYIPKSSYLIQFHYYMDNDTLGYWGYKSWTGNNPQMRPENTVKYYATQNVVHNDDHISHQGVGYWEGHDTVYLIANGTMSGQTPYDYFWYSSLNSGINGGSLAMTSTEMTYQENSVYKSNKTDNNTAAHFYRCTFRKNNQTGSGNETGTKILFPGCYFDWEGNRWLGSLTSGERGAGDDNTGGSSDVGSTGITTSTSGEGIYLWGNLDGGNNYLQYAKFDSTGVNASVKLNFTQSGNYSIKIKAINSSNSERMLARDRNGESVTLQSNSSPQCGLSYSNTHTQPISLNVNETGAYIITVKRKTESNGNISFVNLQFDKA